ncbi:hypothetical protein [Deinococcus altitudinis]|uniref:hypothetical protein n=1 Tax=Deinococcus altitudinis TaxID=468914 RepID=UPI003891E949
MSGPRQTAADRAATVRLVLAQLEAEGVRVLLNAAGDGVRLEAEGPPSAEVVRLARTHRAALLEALAPARREAPAPKAERPPAAARSSFAGQLEVQAQTPGHCGMCARWEALTAPLAHLGECSAGRLAHGWHDGPSGQAVEIHAAHACTAWEGKGFRARVSGKRYGPRPPAEPGVSR